MSKVGRRTLLSELRDGDGIANEARLEAAHAANRALRRDIRQVKRALGEALEFSDALAAAMEPVPPLEIPAWRHGMKGHPQAALGILLGDWHTGTRATSEEMGGFNSFDLKTLQARLTVLVEGVGRWLKGARAAYRIERAHVLVLGDLIHGEIHPEEYARTNELTIPEQVVWAGKLLGEVLLAVRGLGLDVMVDMIGVCNHARLTRKIQCADAARNSYNYLIAAMVERHLEEQGHIKFKHHAQLRATVEVEGRQVLMEHGHGVKAWQGIPYYGLERAEGREARKRLIYGRPGDFYQLHVYGHWHVPSQFQNIIVNGAMCGALPFDDLASRHAEASQTTFLMHKRHGWFNYTPWTLGGGRG